MRFRHFRYLLGHTLLCLAIVACATEKKKSPPIEAPVVKAEEPQDPYIWLEDIEGIKALDWVKTQNQKSLARLTKDTRFHGIETQIESILSSHDRIPSVRMDRHWLYNFWQDKKNVRGVWRRTTAEEYQKTNPAWTVLIDLDQLASHEKENWVWKGSECLVDESRCLIHLSRGGKDATVVREFDPNKKEFVLEGFQLQEAKLDITWLDKDRVYVATDFGPGSLTTSGYPRIVKLWTRGQKLTEAQTVFESDVNDVDAHVSVINRPEGPYTIIERHIGFWKTRFYFVSDNQQLQQLNIAENADLEGIYHGQLIWYIRQDWSVSGHIFKSGSLVSVPISEQLKSDFSHAAVMFEPTNSQAIEDSIETQGAVYVFYTDNVAGKMDRLEWTGKGWGTQHINVPRFGSVQLESANSFRDTILFTYEGFLQPTTLYSLSDKKDNPIKLKSLKPQFDSSRLSVSQHFATSRDGTKIPYFLVGARDSHSPMPTILFGYGGFEVNMTPHYLSSRGKIWLERGYNFVLANIRGGGEFGPKWHSTVVKQKRQIVFDDFIGVAEDLTRNQVTDSNHLAIEGGSNGGLLVSTVMLERPDLFGAIVCEVPLTDMLRYTKLLAGASWIEEYGDPEKPDERDALLKYSPYQNVVRDRKYPEIFLYTSTRDDRVHPGHARKFAAKLEDFGHPVLYYENTEGGHSAGANLKQKAKQGALVYTYLLQSLVDRRKLSSEKF